MQRRDAEDGVIRPMEKRKAKEEIPWCGEVREHMQVVDVTGTCKGRDEKETGDPLAVTTFTVVTERWRMFLRMILN